MHNVFPKALIPVAAGVALFIVAASYFPARAQDAPARRPRSQRSPNAARKFPAIEDPTVIDQQGFEQLLAKYHGKFLLVNFWATWCEPCRDEYPMLNELAKKYAPQGLQVVGVSLDDDGEIILVRRFLARYKPIFPNFRKRRGKEEEFINVVDKKWSGSIPASFFYARDGRQMGQIVGGNKQEVYEAAIRSLLSAGSKDAAPSQPYGLADRR